MSAVASLLLAAAAGAHDFWLEPSSFELAVGAGASVALRVGQGFVGDAVPRDPAKIVRFVAVSPDGESEVAGKEGADPAGFVRAAAPGLYVVGYRSTDAPLSLEPRKFEDYLRLEGLDWVIAERARRGETELPSRETYSRCAKALLRVGGTTAPPRGFDRDLGFILELVPEATPYSLHGATLPVRLLFDGKPLAGALVVAMPRDEPARAVSARSGRDGHVRLPLDRAGVWLVKAVHMRRLPAGAAADWQSFWASLTFEIPAL